MFGNHLMHGNVRLHPQSDADILRQCVEVFAGASKLAKNSLGGR
jgi:hypothetical protein